MNSSQLFRKVAWGFIATFVFIMCMFFGLSYLITSIQLGNWGPTSLVALAMACVIAIHRLVKYTGPEFKNQAKTRN